MNYDELLSYFSYKELIPKEFHRFCNAGLRYIDNRLLACLLYIRKGIGKKISVNTKSDDGRTIRLPRHSSYKPTSGHSFGRCIDFIVEGMNSLDVQEWIIEHEKELMAIGLTGIEKDTEGWTHITCEDFTFWEIDKNGDLYWIPA